MEIDNIHFYNTFEHILFKCDFGTESYEFSRCNFNKSYSFVCGRKHKCVIYII